MNKECQQCGGIFFADEDWKRLCIDCWKENNNTKRTTSVGSFTRRCGSCNSVFNADQEWKRECFDCWKRRQVWESELGDEVRYLREEVRQLRNRPESHGCPQWIVDNLAWLLQKIHPDKHGGSPIATSITKELIQLRGRAK